MLGDAEISGDKCDQERRREDSIIQRN